MIKVGDRLPEAKFRVMTAEGPAVKTTDDVFKGKKVVLFAVPGAFTPTCHKNHLPGYVKSADAITAKGVDAIAVTGVNDVFVMDAWKKASGADKIEFLSDGNGDFAKALDLIKRGKPIRYEGVIGPVSFDQYGDITGPFRLWRITDGKVVTVGEMSTDDVNALKAKIAK